MFENKINKIKKKKPPNPENNILKLIDPTHTDTAGKYTDFHRV